MPLLIICFNRFCIFYLTILNFVLRYRKSKVMIFVLVCRIYRVLNDCHDFFVFVKFLFFLFLFLFFSLQSLLSNSSRIDDNFVSVFFLFLFINFLFCLVLSFPPPYLIITSFPVLHLSKTKKRN